MSAPSLVTDADVEAFGRAFYDARFAGDLTWDQMPEASRARLRADIRRALEVVMTPKAPRRCTGSAIKGMVKLKCAEPDDHAGRHWAYLGGVLHEW